MMATAEPMTRVQITAVLRLLISCQRRLKAPTYEALIERIITVTGDRLPVSANALPNYITHLISLGCMVIATNDNGVQLKILPYGLAVAERQSDSSLDRLYPQSDDRFTHLLNLLRSGVISDPIIRSLSLKLRLSRQEVEELLLAAEEAGWVELRFNDTGQIVTATALARRRIRRTDLPPMPRKIARSTSTPRHQTEVISHSNGTHHTEPKAMPVKRAVVVPRTTERPVKIKVDKPKVARPPTAYLRRLKAILTYLSQLPDQTLTCDGMNGQTLQVLRDLDGIGGNSSTIPNALYGARHIGYIELIEEHRVLVGIRLTDMGRTWLKEHTVPS